MNATAYLLESILSDSNCRSYWQTFTTPSTNLDRLADHLRETFTADLTATAAALVADYRDEFTANLLRAVCDSVDWTHLASDLLAELTN